MAQPKSTSAQTRRDVTRALALAKELQANPSFREGGGFDELIQLLAEMDARTGKRDPSKRTKRAAAKKPVRQ